MADRNNREVTFEIYEHVAVLSEGKDGWKKEVTITSWNGGADMRGDRGMIYEFIDNLKHYVKSIIHFFRAMFCRHYRNGGCAIQVNNCRYWLCPKRKAKMKGADDE